jgi:hypothetical protein
MGDGKFQVACPRAAAPSINGRSGGRVPARIHLGSPMRYSEELLTYS